MTTMVTSTENIFFIKFRTKFEKLVTDANRQDLISAFKQFCSYDPKSDYALQVLWQLTYDSDIALSTFVERLCLNPDTFSIDNIPKLRDELRYQYERLNGSYLLTKVPLYYASEFNNLVKCTSNIIADVVVKKCEENCEFNINPFRALYLMGSDQEKNYFGGLRELGFNSSESQFLKQYHTEIYNLYKALCEKYSPEGALSDVINQNAKDDEESLPFTLDAIADTSDSAKEISTKVTFDYKRVISENVILNREIFTVFAHSDDFNILPAIASLGFDLNEVMSKKEKIRNLIDAIEEKERAESKLHEANANLNS